MELCRRAAAGIQAQLKLDKLEIKWIGASTPERLKMVAAGKADLECGITTHTLRRQEQVDFSLPVYIDGGGVPDRAGSVAGSNGESVDHRGARGLARSIAFPPACSRRPQLQ